MYVYIYVYTHICVCVFLLTVVSWFFEAMKQCVF